MCIRDSLLLLTKLNFDISLLTATFIHTTSGLLGALTMLPGGLVFTEAITVSILKLQTIPIDYGIPITSIIRFCLLYTSPSPRDRTRSRMPSSA